MDEQIKKTIDELETMTNQDRLIPKDITTMKPHERLLGEAIAHAAVRLGLTDAEVISAIARLHAYLTYKVAELKGFTNDN